MSRLNHEPPQGMRDNDIFFITLCTLPRGANQLCHPTIGAEILETIEAYHQSGRWFCHLALLMPDHVHLLIASTSPLSRIIGSWKKWAEREHSIQWQRNFFDHRLRDDENLIQKGEYILQNPVRAKLIKRSEDWPYLWRPIP